MDGNVCCNYYGINGACVASCPENSYDSANFTCLCNSGFQPNNSRCANINDCTSNSCHNGGVCTDLISDYNCTCVPGYTGRNCSTNINECSPDPCQNGGSCTELINGYHCACEPGHTDKDCSTITNNSCT